MVRLMRSISMARWGRKSNFCSPERRLNIGISLGCLWETEREEVFDTYFNKDDCQVIKLFSREGEIHYQKKKKKKDNTAKKQLIQQNKYSRLNKDNSVHIQKIWF